MSAIIRFDRISLYSSDRSDQFESFVRERLFPTMTSAYRQLTRKTIASLGDQALLREGPDGAGDGAGYVWTSAWLGLPNAVKDKDFEGVFMGEKEDVKAVLRELEGFGRREEPQVYQCLAGSLNLLPESPG